MLNLGSMVLGLSVGIKCRTFWVLGLKTQCFPATACECVFVSGAEVLLYFLHKCGYLLLPDTVPFVCVYIYIYIYVCVCACVSVCVCLFQLIYIHVHRTVLLWYLLPSPI